MSYLPLGQLDHSDLAIHRIHKLQKDFSISDTTVQNYEIELLKCIALGDPTEFNTEGNITVLGQVENISNDLNKHILINNHSNDSNIALVVDFKRDTDVIGNSTFDEKHNVDKLYAESLFTNEVKLDDNTAPLYNGHLVFNFTDSGPTISSTEGHYLSFDSDHADYNFFKYVNSKQANTETNSNDGIICTIDNDFNHNHAFLTDKILERALDNKISVKKDTDSITDLVLGADSIRIQSDPTDEFLECTFLDSEEYPLAKPIFGALKFVQPSDQVDFPTAYNNIEASSTLSKLLNDTDIISEPDQSYTTTEFKTLFTDEKLSKIGPGYNFKINILPSTSNDDGYNFGVENSISIPNYGDNNTQTTSTPDTMFTINNDTILENINYMTQMKENDYFNNNSHSIFVRNGNLKLDNSQSANLNFTNFEILDGVEKLTVLNNSHKSDLEQNGSIKIITTNNILGDDNSRFRKYEDNTYLNTISTTSRINRLVVSYANTESEFREDTGIIHEDLKNNYFVRSKLTLLNNSTDTRKNTTIWSNNELNAGQANNSVLVFKESPNSNWFNATNIDNYEAVGLNTYMTTTPENFALFEVTKTMEFSNESTLYRVSDNTAIQDNVIFLNMKDLDLNQLNAQDVRVSIYCKKYTDLPLPPVQDEWHWVTGNSTDGTIDSVSNNSNNGYILSKKDDETYGGDKINSMLDSEDISVEFMLITDSASTISQNNLSRKGKINITYSGETITEYIENGDPDIKFFYKSEYTVNNGVQSITGYSLPSGYKIADYEVQKLTTTRVYDFAIKNKVGPYRNLWITKEDITEYTEWYQVWDTKNNAQVAFAVLKNIRYNGQQVFKSSRRFLSGTNTVSSLSTTVNFKPKDFMGLTGSIEYQTENIWEPFALESDPYYQYSIDTIYSKLSTFTLLDQSNNQLAILSLAIDIPENEFIGKVEDTSSGDIDGAMYRINISVSEGTTSFFVKGRIYDNINNAQYLTNNWSPYSKDTFLLKNDGNLVGDEIQNLTTNVEYIDPSPDTDNVNKVNKIKVTIKNGDTNLFSFISNKYILENFNILYMPKALVKHEYIVNKTAYLSYGNDVIQAGTEYLSSTFVDEDLDIVNLKFGTDYTGIRAELIESVLNPESQSFFQLAGDKININLISNNLNLYNSYTGLYSNTNGEEITASTSGYTLPTNSVIHRNIVPTYFRGLLNDGELTIIRTKSVVKMVIKNSNSTGDIFVDNMDSTNNSTSSELWTDRNTLVSNNLLKVSPEYTELSNMDNHDLGTTQDIGGIGLKIIPKYSMFPTFISSTTLPLSLNPSSFTKVIENPSNPELYESVSDDLFSVILHEFINFKLVATRIKVNGEEKYNFKTAVTPDLHLYYSPKYIEDPRDFTESEWTLVRDDITNTNLLASFVFGVVKFKRTKDVVSPFTKYIILPKPIAMIEAYNVDQILENLPHDFSDKGYLKVSRYIDINLLDGNNYISPSNQQHKPYDPVPPTTGNNLLNSVSASLGVNNFTVGFNITNYLHLKEQVVQPFRFQIKSNTLVIKSGVGLISENLQNYTQIFTGLVEELNDITKWHITFGYDIINTFNNGKWYLKIPQLKTPISQFLDNPLLNNNNIIINEITPFGIGEYSLDLKILDSVKIKYYKVNHVYNFDEDKHQLEFFRYSTLEGLPSNSYDMTKSSIFKPMIYTKEKLTLQLELAIPNILTEVPYNVEEQIETMIKSMIEAHDFTNESWNADVEFVPSKSSFSFTTLSKKGASSLHNIFHVTNENPLKVLVSKRPPILHVTRADGSTSFKINHDGKILTNNITTRKIELLSNFSSEAILPYLNSAPFQEGNLYQNTEN